MFFVDDCNSVVCHSVFVKKCSCSEYIDDALEKNKAHICKIINH